MLNDNVNTQVIQAMPLEEDLEAITTGTVTGAEILHCTEDGTVTITYDTGTENSVDFIAGTYRTLPFITSVEVTAGTFAFSKGR